MTYRITILLALSLSLATVQAAIADDLVVTSWGGSYETSQRKGYGESFESRTGAEIRWDEYQGGLDGVREQVESGDVRWDIVDVFASDARTGCEEGLFEKLPASFYAENGMDADLLVERPNDCVAPNILWSWVTAYDARAFDSEQPTTVADFFDLERFPGKRALGVFPQSNMEMALVADGVAPNEVYELLSTEEGMDRAFAKLSELKGNLEFWSSGEEPVEMLKSGEVAMATAYSGRVGAAALQGDAFIRTIFDGQVVEEEWFAVLKGAPNREVAIDFLRHVAEPAQQARQAKWIAYGPMRRSALEIIEEGEPWFHAGAEIVPYLPTTTARLNRSVIADPDWWAKNGEAVTERFAAWRRSLGY